MDEAKEMEMHNSGPTVVCISTMLYSVSFSSVYFAKPNLTHRCLPSFVARVMDIAMRYVLVFFLTLVDLCMLSWASLPGEIEVRDGWVCIDISIK